MPSSPARTTRHATATSFAAGLVLTLVLAACSSGGSDNSSSPTTTVAPSTSGTTTSTAPGSSTSSATPVPSTSAPTSAVPTTAVKDECTAEALNVTLGNSGAAAGTEYSVIVFTNRSSSTCSMQGFPGASFVDGSGHQLGSAASRDNANPVALVPLVPGASAHALFGYHPAGFYDPSACGTPVTSTALRVYPPDSTTAIELPSAQAMCPSDVGQTQIQAVGPGAAAQ